MCLITRASSFSLYKLFSLFKSSACVSTCRHVDVKGCVRACIYSKTCNIFSVSLLVLPCNHRYTAFLKVLLFMSITLLLRVYNFVYRYGHINLKVLYCNIIIISIIWSLYCLSKLTDLYEARTFSFVFL